MRFTIKNLYWVDISILLLALIVTLWGIGSYGLYEPHEGHFAMVGREMVWRDDWITPHLNGSPYLNKPPLLYWLIASSTKIFGYSEFSARLPVGLVGWFGIVIAWKWTRELWGINSSRICALMLSVTLGWFIFTHQILIDVPLGTFLLSSNYFLWRSLTRPYSWIDWWGTYFSLALCILTKGAIGIVFPLFGCFMLIAIRRDWKLIYKIKLLPGILLVLALILPWFIAIERANPGFWHYFIVNEHLDRLWDRRFPPDYTVSKVSAIGYLAITACWCFPWIIFLPSVVKFSWRQWRDRYLLATSVKERQTADGIFLLAIAAILPVISFLPFSSRLIYYSIPAIPPYVMLCAGWWNRWQPRSFKTATYSVKTDKLYGAIAIIIGLLCYSITPAIKTIVSLLPAVMPTSEVTRLIVIIAIALGTSWLVSGIGMFKRAYWALFPLVAGLIMTYVITVRGFYLYQNIRSSKMLVQQANACLNADTLWIFEGSRELGAAGAVSYYLNQSNITKPISQRSGWTAERTYRTVMVLADGGINRLPPKFPGSPPRYLIDRDRLQTYWQSDRPVVFLTDFLRQPAHNSDPITLNLPQKAGQPYIVSGQRQLYLNQAARKLSRKKCKGND